MRIRDIAPVIAVAVMLLTGIVVASLWLTGVRPDGIANPQTAINSVPVSLRKLPVFNQYGFGGPLIHNGIRVFIDGRADVYGDDFVTDYVQIADGDIPKWNVAMKKWHFAWSILPPKNKLSAYLDKQPDWVRVYADEWAVIHVRRDRLDDWTGAPAAVNRLPGPAGGR